MPKEISDFVLNDKEIEEVAGGSTKEEIQVEIEKLQKIVADLRWQLEFKTMSEADQEALKRRIIHYQSKLSKLMAQLEKL